MDNLEVLVASKLRNIPDFPEPGVQFKDFTPLLGDPRVFRAVVDDTADRFRGQVDVVVGIEARGFMFGAATAYALGVGFAPIRKQGKLPAETHTESYDLEYGQACVEIHVDALDGAPRALIMDDVLATGGTADAACRLVERAGGTVIGIDVVIEIVELGGRDRLAPRRVHSVLKI